MLFLKTLVGAESAGFEHFRLRFGVAVSYGLVVNLDLFDTHTDGNEAVIKLQWIAAEVLSHVGDGFGDELENGRRYLIGWISRYEFGKFRDEIYAHCNREALDDGVIEGGGQGGGVEGFRIFKVCNTVNV